MLTIALKLAITPLLIGGASLAARRWGNRVGGLLVALPLTSGPIAFFLAVDHGPRFAADSAVGMLAGTISQVAFALTYRAVARQGWRFPFLAGVAAFAVATVLLGNLHAAVLPTFVLVAVVLAAATVIIRRGQQAVPPRPAVRLPWWDVPLRMLVATAIVCSITAIAPVIGPHLAGLLSPFPVFGVVLALFARRVEGQAAATSVLEGLTLGLASPAVFFAALALTLPTLGLTAFSIATAAAAGTQVVSMLATPRAVTA